MTDYCFNCGVHNLLDAVTCWCGTCLDTWTQDRQAGEREP